MRIAVFSDSHGETQNMIRAVRAFDPDLIVHLGDYARDALALKTAFPHTPLRAVRGNCDLVSDLPERELFSFGPILVMIAHGHRYDVKRGTDAIICSARAEGADLLLFGHTHRALVTESGGLRIVNPGSAGRGPASGWARVEVSGGGAVSCKIVLF